MKSMGRWNERTRMLIVLELAVCLPAAALIAFNIIHLKSLQRDRGVEAAIQRDFQQMLAISEKRIAGYAYDMVEAARSEFPTPDQAMAPRLDKVLADHPEVAHVFIYDKEKGTVVRSQPRRMQEHDFRVESEKMASMIAGWLPLEGEEIVQKLWKTEKKDGKPFYFFGNSVPRGERHAYQPAVMFALRGVPESRITVAGLAFDAEYIQNSFFPQMLDKMLQCNTNGTPETNTPNRAVLMLHMRKDPQPIAASADWDGGPPEVERNIEAAFPGLALAIKYRGVTVEQIAQKFLRTSYLILGALSLLMAGGIFLTYRSVMKEVALAKLKSDFVSNVSHELRTPLSLIRLYAETLEMGRLTNPEKYQEYYCIIRKESERLTALINNILDFSRIEAGRKEYEFRETDLAELVRNTLDAYRYQIEQHGFAFQQNIDENLPTVQVDREAIARSVLNLVNNAVKYSSDNKFLGVNLYRSNGVVKIEVVDHGIGIPRQEQHKIFEKFYRASDPLVHNTKGSGLGLSLVRHIVHAHGGEVSVESAPGRGSKFTIALPVNAQSKVAGAGAAS